MFGYFYNKIAILTGNQDQAHLLAQLGKYLAKAHVLDQKRMAKKNIHAIASPRDPEFINKIIDSKGHCSGFTPLVLYALWLQLQPKKSDAEKKSNDQNNNNAVNDDQTSQRDDYVWLMNVYARLAKWDGNINSLTIEDGENFDRLLNHIEFFQNIDKYLHKAASGELSNSIEDTKGTQISREYALGGIFNENDLAFILPHIIKEGRLLLITSHNHATGIFMQGKDIYFYDANDSSEIKKLTLSSNENKKIFKKIAKKIHKANSEKNMFIPIGFRSFAIGKVSPEKYPRQEDLLKQTEIIQQNKVNYCADHEDKFTPLAMAAKIGDEDSVRYYLSLNADPFAETKEKLISFELAASRGYTEVVKLLLKKMQEQPDFKIEDEHIINAVTTASSDHFQDIISVIGEALINTNKIQDKNKFSLLLEKLIMGASILNNNQLLLALIVKGIETNMLSFDNLRNEHFSLILKYCDPGTIVDVLLILQKYQDKQTSISFFLDAFHQAALADNSSVICLLLKQRANFYVDLHMLVHEKNNEGRNAFQLSLLTKEGSKALSELMLVIDKETELGEMLFAKDVHQNNVFHLAAGSINGAQKIEILNELFLFSNSHLEIKKMLNELNAKDSTPFYHAVTSGGSEEMLALINLAKKNDQSINENLSKKEKIADSILSKMITARGSYDNTVLHAAINRSNVNIIDTLLSIIKANKEIFVKLMTAVNAEGNNPLHYIVRKTNINVEILNRIMNSLDDSLLSGLLIAKNENGLTPIAIAEASLSKNPANKEAVAILKSTMEKLGVSSSHLNKPSVNPPIIR